MKLGIVGPAKFVDKINAIVEADFCQIEPQKICYREYIEAPDLVEKYASSLDAILFSGFTPFAYAEKHLKPTVPWEFIPRSPHSLVQTLLKFTLSQKETCYKLSSDLYTTQHLRQIFQEIEIPQERFHIFSLPLKKIDSSYMSYVYNFHVENYQVHHVSCCITAYYQIYERLAEANIPCVIVEPTAALIREILHKVQLKYQIHVSQQSQIIAVCIHIDSPDEYSLLSEDDYQYIIEKTKVTREIYLFAQQIQAAVIETGNQDYLLFATKEMIETTTDHFTKIDFLDRVISHTISTVSIGIGYGKTAREAKKNAAVGMMRAAHLGGSRAFIVYNDNKIVGPLLASAKEHPLNETASVDQSFLNIAEKTEISVNTVFRLHGIIASQGKNRFTARELASLLGVTLRTMNRILAKLTHHGFCYEVGKRVVNKAGRPSRIIELALP